MANQKISALTSASTPLAGTEVLPIVQGGSTVKVATLDVTGGVYIGKGASNLASNTVVGNAAFTAVTTGSNSVIVGQSAAVLTTTGIQNTVVGQEAFYNNVAGSYNAAFGRDSLVQSTSDKNSGFGWHSGYNLTSGFNNAFWGHDAQPSAAAVNNEYTYGDANVNVHRFPNGNLSLGTAAKGINFTANTPAAGMTSQLLNWYEEGTFAATLNSFTIVNGTGAISAAGYYTKIGRLVFWGVNISGTGTATIASTGNSSNVTGIPFTQSNRSPFLCQNGAISMTSSPGNLISNTAYTPTWAALTPSSSGVINITGCFNA